VLNRFLPEKFQSSKEIKEEILSLRKVAAKICADKKRAISFIKKLNKTLNNKP
jgi:hypothetical protein